MRISSTNILTLGPAYRCPKGGIAQVLHTYYQFVYENMKHIQISGGDNMIKKIWIVFRALILLNLKLIFDKNIQIIHIHTASNNDFWRSSLFVTVAKIYKKKVVLHIHGGGFKEYYEQNRSFVDSVLVKSNAIISLSEYWLDFFKNELGYLNTHIVHNIIPEPIVQEFPSDGKCHLLYLGHIYQKKGIFDLVDVILNNRKEYSGKLKLHIGGGLFETGKLKTLLTNYRAEDLITFHGWVDGKEKTKLLNIANAYILPSYAEGIPISILEAMSYHLPIISTKVGGIPDIVDDTCGILVEPGNLQQLKDAIDVLIYSREEFEERGNVAYLRSLLHHPNQIIAELNEIYKELSN